MMMKELGSTAKLSKSEQIGKRSSASQQKHQSGSQQLHNLIRKYK